MKNKELQQFLQTFPEDIEILLINRDGTTLTADLDIFSTTVVKVTKHNAYNETSFHFNKDDSLSEFGTVNDEVAIIID